MQSASQENVAISSQILATAERERVRFINLQFTDVVGLVKSVTIPIEQFADAIERGKWFDGSSIEGFARIAESDMYLMPDLRTFAVIPWEQEPYTTARVICWVHTPNGEPFQGDPRVVLQNALDRARSLGFRFVVGPELEFFLFRRDEDGQIAALPHDRGGYFDYSTDLAYQIRKETVDALQSMGINVEMSHHEVAAGQHEIDFEYDDALATADNAVTFKYTLKAIVQSHGLHATFMPKPIHGIDGSGMHCHQLLFDAKGNNSFSDPSDEYGISEIARQFIAGQLSHARASTAVLAPLVNSYKRLVPDFEAPTYVSWARVNRSALIRVPRISPGHTDSTRVELRSPDPSCNPYLAFSVMLHCGLDGVERGLLLPEPMEENLYSFDEAERSRHRIEMLPSSLNDALAALCQDEVVQNALGPHIFDRFLEAKRIEWDEYRASVSPWELDRYLEEF